MILVTRPRRVPTGIYSVPTAEPARIQTTPTSGATVPKADCELISCVELDCLIVLSSANFQFWIFCRSIWNKSAGIPVNLTSQKMPPVVWSAKMADNAKVDSKTTPSSKSSERVSRVMTRNTLSYLNIASAPITSLVSSASTSSRFVLGVTMCVYTAPSVLSGTKVAVPAK